LAAVGTTRLAAVGTTAIGQAGNSADVPSAAKRERDTMTRLGIVLLAAALAASALGCSGGTATVRGTVKLDGNPLEDGKIRFEPADGQGPTAEAVIEEGRYEVELVPGPKRVMIEGWRVVGQQKVTPDDPGSPMIDVKEPVVPAQYNTNTELTYDAAKSDTKDFELSSQ
jgi:hypothetical protein